MTNCQCPTGGVGVDKLRGLLYNITYAVHMFILQQPSSFNENFKSFY